MLKALALSGAAMLAAAVPVDAATWSKPRSAPVGDQLAGAPQLVFGSDGRALITVNRGRFFGPWHTVAITRSAAGELGSARSIPRLVAAPAALSGDRLVALGQTFVRRPEHAGPATFGFGVSISDLS